MVNLFDVNHLKIYLFSIVFYLFTVLQLTASDTISVSIYKFHIDHEIKLIIINQNVSDINYQYPLNKSVILCDNYYTFQDSVETITIGTLYDVKDVNNDNYVLYFTNLPIVHINTNNIIVDEPRVHATFLMAQYDHPIITSDIGIEIRGGTSQHLPKKSYRIEFWADTIGSQKVNVQLLGMRTDDDWNLQAMYNEPLRLRNKVGFEIWNSIHEIYYTFLEPEAASGVRMEYIELFLNSEYKGIYALSERIDSKQLKLKSYNENIRGQLFKGVAWGASTFTSVPDYDNSSIFWGGFKYIFPKEEIQWSQLYQLIHFIVKAEDEIFYSDYYHKIRLDNTIDYFILLNLLRALDNTGKNVYIGRYNKHHPYFFIPWDLDGSFGLFWDGTLITDTLGILTNGYYDRVIKDCATGKFARSLSKRWHELREDKLSHATIMNKFYHHHNYLFSNGSYNREALAWPAYSYDNEQLNYISEWLKARLDFLDVEFKQICKDEVTENEENYFSIYPNPVTTHIYIDLMDYDLPVNASIMSISGQELLSWTIKDNNSILDISGISQGIYLMVFKSNDFNFVKKIIICSGE